MGALLEPTKDVVEQEIRETGDPDGFVLSSITNYNFYNTSRWTLQRLYDNAPDNNALLLANILDYIAGYSPNVKDILTRFNYEYLLRRLADADRLLVTIGKFVDPACGTGGMLTQALDYIENFCELCKGRNVTSEDLPTMNKSERTIQGGWNDDEWNVDSLWLIPERAKGGRRSNVYHGNFVPQIPNQLIRRYTHEGDLVLELFSGSGTTLYECDTLRRNYIGLDINTEMLEFAKKQMGDESNIFYALHECDVTQEEQMKSCVMADLSALNKQGADFLIAHPPYLDIVKFTDKGNDLSSIGDVNVFIDKLNTALQNGLRYLAKNKYFAVVMGDVYKNSEVVPLAFYTMDAVKLNNAVKLKGIIVKNIEGNRGKLGVSNIWRSRALRSDYFLFKHEYIFVFKKL